jgi:AbrB family looped-hinge helix DNA binding protein
MDRIAVVSTKGQVTIPQPIREALDLKRGDALVFTAEEDKITAVPLPGNFLELYGSVKPRRRPENFREIRKRITTAIAKNAASEGQIP